jgi:hypothetical protein
MTMTTMAGVAKLSASGQYVFHHLLLFVRQQDERSAQPFHCP